jgi:hypothetical protein
MRSDFTRRHCKLDASKIGRKSPMLSHCNRIGKCFRHSESVIPLFFFEIRREGPLDIGLEFDGSSALALSRKLGVFIHGKFNST